MMYQRELDFLKKLEKEIDESPNDEPIYWNGRYLRSMISDYFKVEDPNPFMNRFVDNGYLVLHEIYNGDNLRNTYYLDTEKLSIHE